ncbi:probable acyl-CoA dehydrogenase 6 [Rhopilema esculentum]|uniref:probable acyl-CoA dehydrogenase 6 n=1 Tax=Rhopilema esculentum TaxID=499914 RepID=UPI0031DB6957|eukprot:gene14638-5724_t
MAFAKLANRCRGLNKSYRVWALCRNVSGKAQAAYELPTTATEALCDEHIFTEEHLQMRNTLNKIIEKDINPYVDEWEKDGQYPAHQVFKKLGDAGLLGVTKPVEFGGLGLDYSYSVALAEELGNIRCGSVPMSIGVQTDMCTPALAKFGSDELRELFLAPSISGDYVGSVGVSEVEAGSDVAAIRTKAVKDGDDYIINGGKMWTTNGAQADWMCILANTSDGPPHKNKSLIIIPTNAEGFVMEKKIEKLGMWASDTVQTHFDNIRVPQKFRIGEEGFGFMYQMFQFQEERLFAAASTVLALERCINETAQYCSQRKIFGKPVLDNQVVHYRLAELMSEVELLRSLLYRATGLYVQGRDVTKFATMLKLKAGRLSREIPDTCLQYWGGMGYTDIEISRMFRDFRLMSIGGGADEVMLSIICKFMGTLPKM